MVESTSHSLTANKKARIRRKIAALLGQAKLEDHQVSIRMVVTPDELKYLYEITEGLQDFKITEMPDADLST